MTTLGLVHGSGSGEAVTAAATGGRSTSQAWAVRKERVKDAQNRQCSFCGRGESRRRRLELHHIRKREHGRSDSWRNTLALCHACHRLIHNVGDRTVPFVGRVILAMQVIGPGESWLLACVYRLLFWCFLCSPVGTSFHPSALHVRPATQPLGAAMEIRAEAI